MKNLFRLIEDLNDIGVNTDADTITEIVENIDNDDFIVDDFRFIAADAIDDIQQNELAQDPYILGSFNTWFVADLTDFPLTREEIEDLQTRDQFEVIGKIIIRLDLVPELQESYVSYDGYGHYFNRQDGNEHLITIGDKQFYVFGGY